MERQGSAQQAPFVVVGWVQVPWGRRGQVRVRPTTDFPERFTPGLRLFLKGEPRTVQSVQWHRDSLLLKLSGVESRTEAEALRGWGLEVPEEEVVPLPEGSYYLFQILGLEVHTTGGERLGVVEEVLKTGSNDVYLVRGSGREVAVPALADVVVEVDLERKRMTVELPEGLALG